MRKSRLAVAAALAVGIVAGGAYLWAVREGEAAVATATADIRAALGPGGSFTYAAASVQPLRGAAVLSQVSLRLPSGALWTATRVHVVPGRGEGRIAALHAEGLRLTVPGDEGLTAATADAHDVVVPGGPAGTPLQVDPADLVFGDATLHAVGVTTAHGTATIATVGVSGYGAEQASGVTVDGFLMPLPGGEAQAIGFAHLAVSGYDLAGLVAATERQTPVPRLMVGPTSRLEIDGVFAARGTIHPVTVDRAVVTATRQGAAGSSSTLSVTGITITPDTPTLNAGFTNLGLTAINARIDSAASYTPAGGVLVLKDATLVVDGLGRLDLELMLDHLDADRLQPGLKGAQAVAAVFAVLMQTQFAAAHLDFVDRGLTDRLLALGAKQTGQPVAALRARLLAGIAADRMFAALPNGAAIQQALATFIDRGGRIALTARPATPLGLLALAQAAEGNPVSLAARLGLDAQWSAAP